MVPNRLVAAIPGVLGLIATACAPSIESVTIVPGSDSQIVTVEARVNESSLGTTDTPQLAFATLPAATPNFVDAGPLTAAGGNLYRRDGLGMPGGQLRARVTVPYRVLFSSAVRTVTKTVDFTVTSATAAGCFPFDIPGVATGGWTADGFFEIVGAQRRNLCAGQAPLIASVGSNYPRDLVAPLGPPFDSLALPLNQPCITNPPANMQSNFLVVDFVSPDLTAVPGWNATSGFELQARHEGASDPNPANQVRLQLTATTPTNQTFADVDGAGNFVFHQLTGPWQAVAMTRPNLAIARARARLFIPRTITGIGPDVRVSIDRVCPKPQ